MIEVLILGAGEHSNPSSDSRYPVWLSEFQGNSILERQMQQFSKLTPQKYVFVFRKADVQSLHLDDMISQITDSFEVVPLTGEAQGAACSALMSIGAVDLDAELLVTNVTDLVSCDISQVVADFRARGADAGVVTFDSVHPRFAFVRCTANGEVIEAAEKRPISRNASTGLFWFKRASDFYDSVRRMIMKDASYDGKFYICPSLNEIILLGGKVVYFEIDKNQYLPVKDSADVASAGGLFALERVGT